jgi:acyl carrier protein
MTELLRVIADALGVSAQAITSETSSETLPAWDSLGHLHVILAVEGHFGTRFRSDEIPRLGSVLALAEHLGLRPMREDPP